MRIEIDSMVDKNYEGFKALFSSLELRVEVLIFEYLAEWKLLESTR